MNNPGKHILVRRQRDLSVGWAQRIVDSHQPGARVSAVQVRSVDVGTSTRWRLQVEHDAPGLPTKWFMKTPSLALKSRLITALPRFLHKEVSFYRALSAYMPLKMPRILAAESYFGRGSTLVMSDLDECAAKPGGAGEALTPAQAKQVVGQLARLHGGYWNKTHTLGRHGWLSGFSHQMENHMGTLLAVPLMKRGLWRSGGLIAGKLHGPALRYAANRRRSKRFLAQGAQTLVHYDCHPGNIFWAEDGPGFLDWQLVRLGEGVGDVAYFLATALAVEDRRRAEKELLAHYAEQLAGQGVFGLDEADLFRRYQAHLVYPFEAMTVTLAIGGMMQHDSNVEMIERAAAAVEDHDSFARLAL